MEDRFQTQKSWQKQNFQELEAFFKGKSILVAPLEPNVQAIELEHDVRALELEAQPLESNINLDFK